MVRFVGIFSPVVRGLLFELGKTRWLSSKKAETELGWSYRPIGETLIDTAVSLRAFGALKT
jgi:dihydroflavonol-4-reductase